MTTCSRDASCNDRGDSPGEEVPLFPGYSADTRGLAQAAVRPPHVRVRKGGDPHCHYNVQSNMPPGTRFDGVRQSRSTTTLHGAATQRTN